MPPPDEPAPILFPLYVSAVTGKPVARFTADGRPAGVFGAVRKVTDPRADLPSGRIAREIALRDFRPKLTWDESEIIAIPADEYEAHERTYRRAIADGALRERTAEEHTLYLAAVEARGKVIATQAKREAEEAAKKAQPSAAPTGGTNP